MSRSRSFESVSAGQLLFRLSIPLFIVAAVAVAGYVILTRMTANIRSGDGPADTSVYVEAEWIPGAVMGSLLPGRFEFEPGDRDVVVISRVHERRPLDSSEIDRLWLELPRDLELGKPVELAQLQDESNLGFDRGVYGKGVFAEMPKVDGMLTLRQRHRDWLVLEITGSLAPLTGPRWVLDDYHVAYLTPQGRHARQTSGSKEASALVPLAAPTPAAHLIGQWHGELVHVHGDSHFDVYFQFNSDGQFAHSTGRGGGAGDGYSAGMKYGSWRLHGDRLVLKTEIFVFDEPKNNDHMDYLKGQPLLILKVHPAGDGITFTGQFLIPGDHDLRIKQLRKTHVPDLFTHRPNPDRKPGFFERPMPSPGEVVPRGVVAP